MQNMYERIAFYSKQAGFKNVTELSKAAGVARAIFTELKSGRTTTITAATGLKIAKACNISVEELFGDKEAFSEVREPEIKKEPAANAADSLDVSMLTEAERGKVAAFMAGLIAARQKP